MLMVFLESFAGQFKDSCEFSEDANGTIHIPNLSDENTVDDVDVSQRNNMMQI